MHECASLFIYYTYYTHVRASLQRNQNLFVADNIDSF
jgi:hypothetical protein